MISDPAAARTARTFWMQSAVISWRVPVSRILPSASQGMQPEAKIRPWALMAWDFFASISVICGMSQGE